jgi:hypothetical protein
VQIAVYNNQVGIEPILQQTFPVPESTARAAADVAATSVAAVDKPASSSSAVPM